MLEINFNPFPVIETERLILRRLHTGDAAEIFFLRSDAGMMTYMDRASLQSHDEAIELIERLLKLDMANEGINWGMTLKGNDRLIGTICLFHFTKEHYRGEIGYMLHPDFQGKGLMQETIAAILDYGFKQLKLHSIEANVNPENKASIKILERNNFVREAYFKENYFYEGKFLDSAIYSLLTPY